MASCSWRQLDTSRQLRRPARTLVLTVPIGRLPLAVKPTIAIAHRLSTLHRADRLVVLDRGLVVEEGSHDDLMAREGAYFRLYEAQARNVDTDLDDKDH